MITNQGYVPVTRYKLPVTPNPMSLNQHQQFYQLLQQSQNPLIVFPKEHNADAIAASLALSNLLKKIGQQPTIACQGFQLPTSLNFLPDTNQIQDQASNFKKFILNIDLSDSPAPDVRHFVDKEQLQIHITPTQGNMSEEHFSPVQSHYQYDLIIAVNAADLETLADIYEMNANFFFQVPIINIDHSIENEHYGHLNIVNIAATSVSEIIYDLIDQIDSNLMDESIATCLLTGMIDKTRSFKVPTVTPKSLNIASRLMTSGGQRATIIQNLYQTKTINALKLWGRILLNLKTDEEQRLAWAEINETDFLETQTTADDLTGVIEELIANIPSVELTALFYNQNSEQHCLIKSEKKHNLLVDFTEYHPQGNKNLIKLSAADAGPMILARLKQMVDYNIYV